MRVRVQLVHTVHARTRTCKPEARTVRVSYTRISVDLTPATSTPQPTRFIALLASDALFSGRSPELTGCLPRHGQPD
jgi:hypothetical protein